MESADSAREIKSLLAIYVEATFEIRKIRIRIIEK